MNTHRLSLVFIILFNYSLSHYALSYFRSQLNDISYKAIPLLPKPLSRNASTNIPNAIHTTEELAEVLDIISQSNKTIDRVTWDQSNGLRISYQ